MVVGEAAMPVSDQLVETLTGTASEVDNRCKIACVHDLGDQTCRVLPIGRFISVAYENAFRVFRGA